jgi:hypothetical protein
MLDCEVVGKLIFDAVPHSFQITNVHSSSGYCAGFRKESTTHNQRYRRSSGSKDRDASPLNAGWTPYCFLEIADRRAVASTTTALGGIISAGEH